MKCELYCNLNYKLNWPSGSVWTRWVPWKRWQTIHACTNLLAMARTTPRRNCEWSPDSCRRQSSYVTVWKFVECCRKYDCYNQMKMALTIVLQQTKRKWTKVRLAQKMIAVASPKLLSRFVIVRSIFLMSCLMKVLERHRKLFDVRKHGSMRMAQCIQGNLPRLYLQLHYSMLTCYNCKPWTRIVTSLESQGREGSSLTLLWCSMFGYTTLCTKELFVWYPPPSSVIHSM